MSHTFDQFVRFTTDAAGLERIFRLLQSIAQILASYTLPLECLLFLLTFVPASSSSPASNPPDAATARAVLFGLRTKLNLARRHFRLFRSLESFGAAQKLYSSLSSSPTSSPTPAPAAMGPRRAIWIDVFGRTFNGMYLLLEASTFLDALGVDGLAPWGPERGATLAVEGQRFWLFSLACGALAGLVRIADVLASAPAAAAAPDATTDGSADAEGQDGDGDLDEKTSEREHGDSSTKKDTEEKQMDYLEWRREARSKIYMLGRRVLIDTLDITIPGSIVGWVPVSTGTVGLAMFVTTVLTSMDIWERCGREVAGSKK